MVENTTIAPNTDGTLALILYITVPVFITCLLILSSLIILGIKLTKRRRRRKELERKKQEIVAEEFREASKQQKIKNATEESGQDVLK